MFSRLLSSTAVLLAATQLVSAQTYTNCNPMEKTCPENPALGKTVAVDFTKGQNDLFKNFVGTTITYDDTLGAVYTTNKETDAPTVGSTKYIFFGKIDLTVRASTGQGIVTSFVLQSDNLDEIDWEWLGGDTTQVQSNYFGKGDTTTYDRGAFHGVSTPQDTFHTYTIDWTKDYVKWYIDGALVRTLLYADAKSGTRFPQTPMQIKLGTWVAGRKDAPIGTVQWAGGYTDFSLAPFHGYYKSITIQDYSNGVDGATSYYWGDKTGSYESIEVLTNGEDSPATTTSAKSSGTKTVTDKDSTSTLSGVDSTKTTMATVTGLAPGGITQATDGVDTGSSSSGSSNTATSTGGGSSSSSGTSEDASASSSAPASSGALKQGLNLMAIGAGLFLVFLF